MINVFAILAFAISCSALESMSFYNCEVTKACFKNSKACTVDNCEFGITWKPMRYQNEEYVEFELIGNVYSNNGYMLVGFSEDGLLVNLVYIVYYV